MTAHVIVIGGGISGLAAAEALTHRDPTLRVTLLEASGRLGGRIRTECGGGFVLETGPDVLLTTKPAGLELARRVGIDHRMHGTSREARGSYVLGARGLQRLPDGLTGLVPTRVGPFVTTKLLSARGKMRVALEYVIPPRRDPDDESVEAFVVRRLGREMYNHLTEPLLSGISAGDGANVSITALFPQLCAMEREHGGLIRGMLAARRERAARMAPMVRERPETDASLGRGASIQDASSTPPAFVSFPEGLSELVTAVERALWIRGTRVGIRRHTPVSHIETGSAEGTFVATLASGERLIGDAVIVATPADVAAWLLRPVDRTLAGQLSEIAYASSITVSVAYPIAAVPRALDATGYVVPKIRERQVLACTWSSAKFQGRAPEGYALFRLFLGGTRRPAAIGMSDTEVTDVVQAEMREVMGIRHEPVLQHIHRFAHAMPQYAVGHLDRVAAIHARAARTPWLHFAGAAYGGAGIPDCIRSAQRAVEGVLHDIAVLPTSTATSVS